MEKRGKGRPRGTAPTSRTVRVEVWLSAIELAQLDERRGDKGRGAYLASMAGLRDPL